MVIKKLLLKKILSGNVAEIKLAFDEDDKTFTAVLFLNGRQCNGPSVPQPLTSHKEDITHFMGTKPPVGLTADEAAMITKAVNDENGMYQQKVEKRWHWPWQ